jgi:hypothetical protein
MGAVHAQGALSEKYVHTTMAAQPWSARHRVRSRSAPFGTLAFVVHRFGRLDLPERCPFSPYHAKTSLNSEIMSFLPKKYRCPCTEDDGKTVKRGTNTKEDERATISKKDELGR